MGIGCYTANDPFTNQDVDRLFIPDCGKWDHMSAASGVVTCGDLPS